MPSPCHAALPPRSACSLEDKGGPPPHDAGPSFSFSPPHLPVPLSLPLSRAGPHHGRALARARRRIAASREPREQIDAHPPLRLVVVFARVPGIVAVSSESSSPPRFLHRLRSPSDAPPSSSPTPPTTPLPCERATASAASSSTSQCEESVREARTRRHRPGFSPPSAVTRRAPARRRQPLPAVADHGLVLRVSAASVLAASRVSLSPPSPLAVRRPPASPSPSPRAPAWAPARPLWRPVGSGA